MADLTQMLSGDRWTGWRIPMWSAAAVLLAAPAIAMRFTKDVQWGPVDFIVMGTILLIVCGVCELAARSSASGAYRVGAIAAAGTAFLTVWANLAVGMVGPEENPYNLLFLGVIAVEATGAIAARGKPAGMARVTAVAAMAQALAAAGGLTSDTRGALFSMAFAVPWLFAAAMFRKAAGEQADAR